MEEGFGASLPSLADLGLDSRLVVHCHHKSIFWRPRGCTAGFDGCAVANDTSIIIHDPDYAGSPK